LTLIRSLFTLRQCCWPPASSYIYCETSTREHINKRRRTFCFILQIL
jgi:hypothetical protein